MRDIAASSVSKSVGPLFGPNPSQAPPVWRWYIALCVVMALGQFAILALGIYTIEKANEWARLGETSPESLRTSGMLLVSMGAIFFVANLLMPFLPRKPWAYLAHLGNILAAALFICPAALAVPVAVYWLKPDMQAWFGLSAKKEPQNRTEA